MCCLPPRRCSNLATLPLNQSQLQYLQIDSQLSQHQQFPTENPTPAPIFFPPIIVSPRNATESNSTQFPKPGPPIRQPTPSTVMVDSSPLSSPASTAESADPPSYHHLLLCTHPPTSEPECTGNEPSITPESQAATARADDIVNREIHARKNNAHARSTMTRKYNKHHHIQSFVAGQYITANISCLDRAATDNKRILCRIVDIAGSKEQPGYKL